MKNAFLIFEDPREDIEVECVSDRHGLSSDFVSTQYGKNKFLDLIRSNMFLHLDRVGKWGATRTGPAFLASLINKPLPRLKTRHTNSQRESGIRNSILNTMSLRYLL